MKIKTLKQAESIAGSLSRPSKMPCYSYSIPAQYCKTGTYLKNLAKHSVCSHCYALKGRYVFENVQQAMEKRYSSLRHPYWVAAMAFMIKRRKNPYFRWHDSGDLQGIWHLQNIVRVAEACPEVQFWLPTRELKMVKEYKTLYGDFPENLTVRVSEPFINIGRSTAGEFPTSSVGDPRFFVSGHLCPAHTQENQCRDCRACWDKSTQRVIYKLH